MRVVLSPIRFLINCLVLGVVLFSSNAPCQDKGYLIKAGFIYNFARYSSLLDNLSDPHNFTLCSSDSDFAEQAKQLLHQKNIKGRSIVTQVVVPGASELSMCNTLFITQDASEQWQYWLEKKASHTMLIVGESRNFLNQGGHISFFRAGTKVRFEVSPTHLKQSGIKISSKVLRLGRVRGAN